MKRFAWVKGLAVMMVMALALTGCFSKGKGPDKAPDVVITEAMEKMSEAKSMNVLIDTDVNVKTIDKVKTGFDKARFAGSFDVGFDLNDEAMPKISIKMDAKGSQNGEKDESAAGEMRLLGKTFYATLTNLSDFKGTVPTAMVQAYLGKWWSIALPEDSTKDLSLYSKDEKTLTDEEKKLKDLYSGKNLFMNEKYEGTEEIDKVDTYVYTAELDKEEFKKTIIEMAKSNGEPLSDVEVKKMDDSWKTVTLTTKLYVDQKAMNMKRILLTLNIKDLEGADVDGTVTITSSNVDGKVVIEEPKDATEFDLGSIFGGMGGYDVPGVEPIDGDPGL